MHILGIYTKYTHILGVYRDIYLRKWPVFSEVFIYRSTPSRLYRSQGTRKNGPCFLRFYIYFRVESTTNIAEEQHNNLVNITKHVL